MVRPRRLTVPMPERVYVLIDGKEVSPRHALRAARIDRGLSAVGLSVSCGIAEDRVRRWESGTQDARLESWVRAMLACGYEVVVRRAVCGLGEVGENAHSNSFSNQQVKVSA